MAFCHLQNKFGSPIFLASESTLLANFLQWLSMFLAIVSKCSVSKALNSLSSIFTETDEDAFGIGIVEVGEDMEVGNKVDTDSQMLVFVARGSRGGGGFCWIHAFEVVEDLVAKADDSEIWVTSVPVLTAGERD